MTNYVNGAASGSPVTNSYTSVFKDVEQNYTFFIGCFIDQGVLTSFRGNIWSLEMEDSVWDDYARYLKYNKCRAENS